MLQVLRNFSASAVLWVLAAFFGVALLYPLGTALVEALREPVRQPCPAAASLPEAAAKLGVTPETLLALNPALKPGSVPSPGTALITGERWTLGHIFGLFAANAPEWRVLLNSLLLAVLTTLGCTLIAFPLAYVHARLEFKGKMLLAGLLLLPLILPPFVGAIGLRRMLAKFGTFNLILMDWLHLLPPDQPIDFLESHRLAGCVVVMVLHFYPLLYLNLTAAIGNIDPALLESARNLGHSPLQTLRRVVVPLAMPGFIAGGSLVFVAAFTDLGTPLVFGYQETVARQIFALANEQHTNRGAPALVAVVTVLVLALFALTRWALSRGTLGGVKGQSRAAARPAGPGATRAILLLHAVVLGFAVLPHLAVLLNAFGQRWFFTALPQALTLEHFNEALHHPLTGVGLRNSLLFSLCSTAIDLVLGLACAWVIVRRGGWWGRLVDGLSIAPLAVPGLVLAFGYIGAYGTLFGKPVGVLGITVTLTTGMFLILSYAIRRLPYTVRACVAGLEQTPRYLEEAAANLGASPWQRLRRVTVPLLTANLVAGGILAFAFAMLEVSDSIILAAHPRDFPLTKSIYQLFGNPGNGDQLASALGVVALVFLSLSLLAAGAFLGKKWGEMFRG